MRNRFYVVGVTDHVPSVVVSVWPTVAVPVIVGGAWLAGVTADPLVGVVAS